MHEESPLLVSEVLTSSLLTQLGLPGGPAVQEETCGSWRTLFYKAVTRQQARWQSTRTLCPGPSSWWHK